jgi:hypothetical protein
VAALRDRFGATHVLLLGQDPKIAAAKSEHWELVWDSGPGTESWWLFTIPEAAEDSPRRALAMMTSDRGFDR